MIRNAQDRQTLGIPIGPDTSFVIAELILAAVDRKVSRRLPGIQGCRFYDDYELYFPTRSEAEAAATILQEVLGEFELDLSAEKTEVAPLPLEHEYPWTSDLRVRGGPSSRYMGESELVRYFDFAFLLARQYPNSHVLSYAVSHLQRRVVEDDWPLVQALLLQAVLAEPGTFKHVVQQFVDADDAGWSSDLDRLGRVMNMQISFHARLGHGSEVAWALWTLIRFGQGLTNAASVDLIHTQGDPVIALLALDARQRGLARRGMRVAPWAATMTASALYGPQWLLSYEASVKGWLPSVGAGDHIASDPAFSVLRARGVSFYDESASLLPTPRAVSADVDDASDEGDSFAELALHAASSDRASS